MGPRTQMMGFRAQILYFDGTWDLKPYRLGLWTLRE